MPFNQNNDTALTNLIVNYLPQNLTDNELFSIFVTIGPVESCRVMRDNKTGYSYGFGFVNFSRQEDATKAINQLNGLEVQNKRLKVSYARPSGDDIKDTNLYITNLPRTITEDQLEDMFGKFGRIVQKNILKDKITGLPRGVAFVRYDRKSEASQAVQEMNGFTPEGCLEPLVVKIAEEHGKQKAAYYAGWHAGYTQSRGSGSGGQKKSGVIPTVVVPAGPRTAVPTVRAGVPARIPAYSTAGMYSQVRANPNGYGGAVRQDKSHYRYNPVGPANAGYNVGGGYY